MTRVRNKLALAGLTAAVAFGAAGAAQAGLIISSSRESGATYDAISFHVSGFTGDDLTYVPSLPDRANGVSVLKGTFTAVGAGAVLSVPGTDAQFPGRTTNPNNATFTPPRSFANFESITGASDFARVAAGSATPTSFSGGWFTTGTGAPDSTRIRPIDTTVESLDDEFDQTLLARIYVTSGAHVSFAGVFSSYASNTAALTFTSVPEPTSLAAGLVVAGLAAARRRRQ